MHARLQPQEALHRTACCSDIVKDGLQDALDQLLEQCLQDHAYLERELKLFTRFIWIVEFKNVYFAFIRQDPWPQKHSILYYTVVRLLANECLFRPQIG